MATGWIESMNNWRCPECDARLVQRGQIVRYPGGANISGSPFPVYCPGGHAMPSAYSSDELDAARDQSGHQADDPNAREMPKPPGA